MVNQRSGTRSSIVFTVLFIQTRNLVTETTDTVANASKTFNLATKNSSLAATLATMFLW